MKAVIDFTLAAFPWVLCGVAVAIICASMGQRKTKEEEQALEQHRPVGKSWSGSGPGSAVGSGAGSTAAEKRSFLMTAEQKNLLLRQHRKQNKNEPHKQNIIHAANDITGCPCIGAACCSIYHA